MLALLSLVWLRMPGFWGEGERGSDWQKVTLCALKQCDQEWFTTDRFLLLELYLLWVKVSGWTLIQRGSNQYSALWSTPLRSGLTSCRPWCITLENNSQESGPRLFECSPSGNYFDYLAVSIGSRSQSAKTYLEKFADSFKEGFLSYLVWQ